MGNKSVKSSAIPQPESKVKPDSKKRKRIRNKPPRPKVTVPAGVSISSLATGARFEHEGQLFRKAIRVRKDREVGQRLVITPTTGGTLVIGAAASFDPKTRVIPQ